MAVRVALTGDAEALDRDVVVEVVALRLFLESRLGAKAPDQATASEGRCFDAARLVVAALNALQPDSWSEWEGYWLSDANLDALAAGVRVSPSRLDEFAQFHGFVVSGEGIFVDITADQFGQSGVVATDNSDGRYHALRPNRGELGDGDAWAGEWPSVRETWLALAESHMPPLEPIFRP